MSSRYHVGEKSGLTTYKFESVHLSGDVNESHQFSCERITVTSKLSALLQYLNQTNIKKYSDKSYICRIEFDR